MLVCATAFNMKPAKGEHTDRKHAKVMNRILKVAKKCEYKDMCDVSCKKFSIFLQKVDDELDAFDFDSSDTNDISNIHNNKTIAQNLMPDRWDVI